MKPKVSKWVYWTPRILSIIFILFLMLFSLDIFGNGYTFWETIVGLFMHNLPAVVLAAILVISWKREIVGGIAFILAGLLYIAIMISNAIKSPAEWYMLSYSIIIAGPAFLVGILFLMNWKARKSTNIKRQSKKKK